MEELSECVEALPSAWPKSTARIAERHQGVPDAERKAWHYASDLGPDEQRFNAAICSQLSTLPVFPLYDAKAAAPLVGKTLDGLYTFLKKHKDIFPARYRVYGQGPRNRRLVRVFTAREVLLIRTYTLLGPGRFTQ